MKLWKTRMENEAQPKIDELEDLLANLPEKAPWQRELDTGLYN